MSSIIQEFGLGLTEYLPALTFINKLQETYFSSVIYAPTFYLLLGNELSSLNNLIHDVLCESAEGRFSMSAIFRNDNKSAAQKAVQLVFNGMDSTLEGLEEALRGSKADRCATKEAWRLWGREVRDNGGEAGLRRALEAIKYHNWEITVVIKRALKRNEIEALLLTAPVTCQYLVNLFTELLSSTGAREFPSELVSKFATSASLPGKTFPTDIPIEKLLKISIYWTFKAVSSVKDNARTSQTLPGEDAVALSKAYWIFEMCRGLIGADIREFKAVLAIIANELAFAAKILLESQIGFPSFELLPEYGDFQIWPSENEPETDAREVEENNSHRPPETPTQEFRSPVGIGTSMGSTVGYSARDSFSRSSGSSNHYAELGIDCRDNDNTHGQWRQDTLSKSSQESSLRRSQSQSQTGAVNGNPSPPGHRFNKSATMPESIGETAFLSIRRASAPVHSNQNYSESNPTPGSNLAYTSSGSWEFLPESVAAEVRNYGASMGEDEILNSRLLASKSYSLENARWEGCGVRVFRKRSKGELRVLTLWDEGPPGELVVKPGEAELVPEYGYHMKTDLPVIFIRNTAEWGSSIQWGKQPKSTKSVGKMTPKNTYFKFHKSEDMFDFQCAFLSESVLADIRTISAVRYKCGFLDGLTSTNFCRVQIWREVEYNSLIRSGTPSPNGFPVASYRGGPKGRILRPRSSRIVIFLGRELLTIFITDDITLDQSSTNSLTVKIKPMSYGRLFGSRGSVKARIAGGRDLPGGIRVDRGGVMIEDEDGFDDLRWLEIEFESSSDMKVFIDNFKKELQVRRKERAEVDELKKKAVSGVRSSGH